jgi:hypothetical protein
MSRALRIEKNGGIYRIYSEARRYGWLCRDRDDFKKLLDIIEEASKRFDLVIYAYCLQGQRYDLLCKIKSGKLSQSIQHINSRYAQYYNHRYKLNGGLFRSRFQAVLLDPDSHAPAIHSRQVHHLWLNTEPKDNTLSSWSKYHPRAENNQNQQSFINTYFPGKSTFKAYRRWITEGQIDIEITSTIRKYNIEGRLEFIHANLEHTEQLSVEVVNSNKLDSRNQEKPCHQDIINHVSQHFDVCNRQICQPTRGRHSQNQARQIAMMLCQNLSGLPLKTIAQEFGLGHYASVANSIGQLKKAMANNEQLRKQVAIIEKDVHRKQYP